MDLLLTKQKYFLFISKNGEINVELKNILLNSLKTEEKYSFFIQLYQAIFQCNKLNFSQKINLLKKEYEDFELFKILINSEFLEQFSYDFFELLNQPLNLNKYKEILNKNKNNVNYLKKAIIFNCLNFMDVYKVLDVDLYFSQDIIDSLYEDEMDIINEEEYFKYQILKDYFIFIYK